MYYGRCWLCGKQGWLEEHHIFGGSNRKKSEKYGLRVAIAGDPGHRTATALRLHQYGQMKYMAEQGATVEQFRAVFGKNYL